MGKLKEHKRLRMRYQYELLVLLLEEKKRNIRDKVRRRKSEDGDITTVDLVEYAREQLGLPPIPAKLLETENPDSD